MVLHVILWRWRELHKQKACKIKSHTYIHIYRYIHILLTQSHTHSAHILIYLCMHTHRQYLVHVQKDIYTCRICRHRTWVQPQDPKNQNKQTDWKIPSLFFRVLNLCFDVTWNCRWVRTNGLFTSCVDSLVVRLCFCCCCCCFCRWLSLVVFLWFVHIFWFVFSERQVYFFRCTHT